MWCLLESGAYLRPGGYWRKYGFGLCHCRVKFFSSKMLCTVLVIDSFNGMCKVSDVSEH